VMWIYIFMQVQVCMYYIYTYLYVNSRLPYTNIDASPVYLRVHTTHITAHATANHIIANSFCFD